MRRMILAAAAALLAGPPLLSGAALAQAPPAATKEQLTQDEGVRATQDPQSTPLGRNPPKVHEGESSPDLQKKIDEAHGGSTGTTTSQPGRSPGNQPDAQKDGSAARPKVPPQ